MIWRRLRPTTTTGDTPGLVVAQRVIDKMVNAANTYVEDETGEALVGVVQPGERGEKPTIYVLDTISPDDTAEREEVRFEQGDSRADEMIWWYVQNWHKAREKGGGFFGGDKEWYALELRHLGDWHRQPGHMIAPSGGDLMTALDLLTDERLNLDFLLAPIVTLEHPPTTSGGEGSVNYVTAPDPNGEYTRVDFWYLEKDGYAFKPIPPVVQPDDRLPSPAPQPWHLNDEVRVNEELDRLEGDGLFHTLFVWDVDGKLPLEICVMTGRRGAEKMVVAVTDYDYPQSAPRAFVAPFSKLGENEVMYDLLGRVWPEAEQVKSVPGWEWSSDKYLLDFIRAVEEHKGLRPAEVPEQDETQANQQAESSSTEVDS